MTVGGERKMTEFQSVVEAPIERGQCGWLRSMSRMMVNGNFSTDGGGGGLVDW